MITVDIATDGDVDPFDIVSLSQHIEKTIHSIHTDPSHPATEVSVLLTDNSTIAYLNQQWRQKTGPTDVLSFGCEDDEWVSNEDDGENYDDDDMDDELFSGIVGSFITALDEDSMPVTLGDIVISLEYATKNVEEQKYLPRIEQMLDDPVHGLDDQAKKQARSFLQHWNLNDEIEFLIIHSYLHLLGMDHQTEEDDYRMQCREFRLWANLKNLELRPLIP